ncbi:MAG: universal stress protein [Desulfobacterales bacterium]|nr:universal stress protein [Desulfobacterales bacterium]
MKPFLKRLLNKSRSFRKKMDEYHESITFAEAGEPAHGGSAAEAEQPEEQPGLLLVIGNGNTFSQRVIDYALEMAQRMSYDILALNVAPIPQEAVKMFAPSRNKIEEFEEKSRENAQAFKAAAEEKGIALTHTVKFGDTDSVVQEVGKEYGPVEFVISEPSEEQAVERPENENRPEKQLYVYSMV